MSDTPGSHRAPSRPGAGPLPAAVLLLGLLALAWALDWLSLTGLLVGIGASAAWLLAHLWRTRNDLRAAADDRRRAEEDLEEQFSLLRRLDEERRELLTRLVGVQDEERRRIAIDLHDDSIQVMTALRLRLGTIKAKIEDPEAQEQLEQLEQLAHDAIARLRRLIFDLYPTDLERQGLAPTLRRALDGSLPPDDVEYELEDELTAEPAEEVRMAAYRIAREALANVRKHANASRVVVLARTDRNELLLRITDDGIGFVPERAESGPPGHLGLVSMRERAELVGGRCTITSAPGAGTTVEFRVPAAGAGARSA